MGVITILNDSEFNDLLSTQRLIVVDFTATWCYPCSRIAPIFEQLSEKYPQATFLKVDVDVCQEIAIAHDVTSMPTFIFYKSGKIIDCMGGANSQLLAHKVAQYLNCESSEGDSLVMAHTDLFPFMKKSGFEALNEAEHHPLMNCLEDNDNFLQSDCDAQLIISIDFVQAVKIHSFAIKAPETFGPKTVKLFINQPITLDFEKAETSLPVQTLHTKISDLMSGIPIPLHFVRFQNVQNMQIFVQDNHSGSDVTRINRLRIFGSPVATIKMENFKKVTGNKEMGAIQQTN